MHPRTDFVQRHIGPGSADAKTMLSTVGVPTMEELIQKTIPGSIRLNTPMNLPDPVGETELLELLRAMGKKNKLFKSYLGMGYYDCITPPVILRNILENPSWYTQYTPYQAEIAQGRLEALLNYQTMVSDLSGLPISNASLLDEGTAAAEAMHMLHAAKSADRGNTFLVSDRCLPQTVAVLQTRSKPLGIKLVVGDWQQWTLSPDCFGLLVQYPDSNGAVSDYSSLAKTARSLNIGVVVAADLLSLTMLKPPGEWGADVVVGSTQRFGVPLGYGGPHAAYFSTREEHKRRLPGRIIGVTIDVHGNRALRMALQTREQHIRREKATSNICTAQVLLANMAGMYAVYHGPDGLRAIAGRIHAMANRLSDAITSAGFKQLNEVYFDTLKIDTGSSEKLEAIRAKALASGINLNYSDGQTIGVSIDETVTENDLNKLAALFGGAISSRSSTIIPASLTRTSSFLEHPVFNSYHSETGMLRYIKSLELKDLSLANSMIPLGSCTMKLNATTEMIPVTWAEFGGIHPFVPADQTEGYRQLFAELESYLNAITGFAATSLQPNAGAQGEYTGLLVIRAYLEDIGQGHRNIALIPSSAHGTNPASAVMAGLKVVVVKCDSDGNIDVNDLRTKAEQHKDSLAALMVTYPSTHGVFEESIREICDVVHKNGGQVYMDGANMNAQVGLTSPAMIGADVCHLNLHKTFCIPHGGGGPGMGPICVAKHLAPFLPGHPLAQTGGSKAMTPVSAAPWGSASILLISYAYIRMMGAAGLKSATEYAILNANYIYSRLKDHYKPLYVGKHGYVAHEMILDTREFKNSAGIEVIDIAKRLMDYGFHAPTVSFPVPGTLMIEPTESEPLEELDRFCEAMISIRKEIADIENATADRNDNLLQNAPHTISSISQNAWLHPYDREQAAFPLPYLKLQKFWPSVGRVNDAHGDRNLICTCPPIEEYETA